MRIAVIDMGTNTFNLLIADVFNTSFKTLVSEKYPVKLGQKLAEQHIIDNDGIIRILDTLKNYLKIIKKYSADEVIALATSSIRTAKNQKEILQTIKNQLNLDIQIIDGEREADLIYIANQYAVSECLNSSGNSFLIMDIGGGSTEFIIANQQTSLWKKSFLLGMARLLDEIQPKDPMTSDDIHRIYSYIDKVLKPLDEKAMQYKPQTLIGSSGVFDSVAEMIEANIHSLDKSSSCCIIDKKDFDIIYKQMLPLAYQERLKYKGLIQMRADMIVVSLILMDYILKKYSLNNFVVSFYSLKEGVIIEKIHQYFDKP